MLALTDRLLEERLEQALKEGCTRLGIDEVKARVAGGCASPLGEEQRVCYAPMQQTTTNWPFIINFTATLCQSSAGSSVFSAIGCHHFVTKLVAKLQQSGLQAVVISVVRMGGYVHKHLISPTHNRATSARPSPRVLELHDSSGEV